MRRMACRRGGGWREGGCSDGWRAKAIPFNLLYPEGNLRN